MTILYRSFLDREPEPAGLAAWEAVVEASLMAVVEAGFLPAMEFDVAARCG